MEDHYEGLRRLLEESSSEEEEEEEELEEEELAIALQLLSTLRTDLRLFK